MCRSVCELTVDYRCNRNLGLHSKSFSWALSLFRLLTARIPGTREESRRSGEEGEGEGRVRKLLSSPPSSVYSLSFQFPQVQTTKKAQNLTDTLATQATAT